MSELSKKSNGKSTKLPQVSKEFLNENQKCKSKSKSRIKKGGPYSKTDRQARRTEVYRLHFGYGYSALKISKLMKINRNTINGDIQYWYQKTLKNWKDSGPELFVIRNIERLELQRTRLVEQIEKAKNFQEKFAIERMILSVESRILQTQLKLSNSIEKIHKLSVTWLNEWMKKNKNRDRYLSYGDIMKVSDKKYEKINHILKDNSLNW